jgi:hypothetical protein
MDWLGVNVSPEETPLTVKPAPAVFEPDIVTFEFPVFVKVAGRSLLLPTFTLPKLRLGTLNVSKRLDAMPVPLRGIRSGEFGASLASDTDPVTFPAAEGVNTALNVAFVPGGIVKGVLSPVIVNPLPEALPCEMTRFAVPLFVSVIVCELLFPTLTFPKGALEGTAPIWACVPLPVRAIVIGEFGALLDTEMLPLALPEDAGENCAVNLAFCPGWIVNPAANPLMVKPVPVTLA